MAALPLYELTGVQHRYQGKSVLEIDHLTLEPGSITGLSGPNGSGKSTLLKILAFAMKPTQGTVRFRGTPARPFSPHIRSKVTLLTQKPYLLKRTVLDNIAYGLKIRKSMDNLEKRAARALDSVGLDAREFAHRPWHELSGGEAQRVAMAARLVLKPEVLLLDEPVASVDAKSARLIRNASLAARKEWGCTLVIVSHDRVWLAESCDYHLSIARGHIFTTGSRIPLPGACIPGPGTGRTPVLEKRDIHILTDKTAWAGVDQKIPGRITAMVFEKKRRHILTTIQVADGSVELSLPCDVTGDLGLMPGKSVILGFHTRDIQWE